MEIFSQGQKVKGKYMGVDFSGSITDRSFNQANHRMVQYFVQLDNQINVLGLERDSIVCEVEIESNKDNRYYTFVEAQ